MAPILLRIKGMHSFTHLASMDSEEELSRTWRICTKVKDSLVNGSRLENLSWRLWHLHKLILDDHSGTSGQVNAPAVKDSRSRANLRSRDVVRRVSSATTRKLALDGITELTSNFAGQLFSLAPPDAEIPPYLPVTASTSNAQSSHGVPSKNEQKTDGQQEPAAVTSAAIDEAVSMLQNYHAIQLDDLFGSFSATAYLGDVEQGPWLGVPDAELLDLTPFLNEDLCPSIADCTPMEVTLPAYAQSTAPQPYTNDWHTPAVDRSSSMTDEQHSHYQQQELLSRLAAGSYQTTWQPFAPATPQPPPASSAAHPSSSSLASSSSSSMASSSHRPSPSNTAQRSTGKKSKLNASASFPAVTAPLSSSTAASTPSITGQHCANCHASSSPLWRRTGHDQVLCNACGLYLKQHNTHRPLALNALSKQLIEDDIIQKTVCDNCQTSNTPLWRKNEHGKILCNACGLFYKMHRSHRPLRLKTDVIKKRPRSEHSPRSSGKKDRSSCDSPTSVPLTAPPLTIFSTQPQHQPFNLSWPQFPTQQSQKQTGTSLADNCASGAVPAAVWQQQPFQPQRPSQLRHPSAI